MSGSKHDPKQVDRAEVELDDDMDQNPAIGKSKGAFATGEDPAIIAGESTVEGDVENDSSLGGGANPKQLGRTNK